jgi:xanthosine utilization system XapX-like protein
MSLKDLIFAWRRTNAAIKIAFISAIIILIIYELILLQIPAPNKIIYNLGRVGIVFIQILYAFVTGCIFYFVIEISQRESRRAALFFILKGKVHSLRTLLSGFVQEVCKNDISLKDWEEINFERFCAIFEEGMVNSKNISSTRLGSLSYQDYYLKMIEIIKQDILILLSFSELLNNKWIKSFGKMFFIISGSEIYIAGNKHYGATNIILPVNVWMLYEQSEVLGELVDKFEKLYKEEIDMMPSNKKLNFTFKKSHSS